jgi:hypothetical protein
VIIATIFVAFRQTALLLGVAAVLYVIGVLDQGYGDTPLGIHSGFNMLYGPFFGTFPFTIGYLLSGHAPKPAWFRYGLVMLIAGYLIHFSEIYLLWKNYHSYPLKHYVFGSWLIGSGMAILALSNRRFPGRDLMARYGRLAIGIYLVQPFFLGAGVLIGHYIHSPLWEVAHVFFVLVLCIVAVRLLMRSRYLRQFVT